MLDRWINTIFSARLKVSEMNYNRDSSTPGLIEPPEIHGVWNVVQQNCAIAALKSGCRFLGERVICHSKRKEAFQA